MQVVGKDQGLPGVSFILDLGLVANVSYSFQSGSVTQVLYSLFSPMWEDPRFRHVINLSWLTWQEMGRVSIQLRSDWNWSCSSIRLPGNKSEEWFYGAYFWRVGVGVGEGEVCFPLSSWCRHCQSSKLEISFCLTWAMLKISGNFTLEPGFGSSPEKWDLQTVSMSILAVFAASSWWEVHSVYLFAAFSVDIPGPPHFGSSTCLILQIPDFVTFGPFII